MQIPFDVVLQGGAVVVLLLWIWDVRKQRDDLQERINRILDKLEVGPKAEPPK